MMGFVGSVNTVYVLVNEIVGVLNAIGFIFSVTDSTLGITLLAWGNSVGGKSVMILFTYIISAELIISVSIGPAVLRMIIPNVVDTCVHVLGYAVFRGRGL